jgi:hypothetical protein
MRASEFVTEAPPRTYDQDTIDLVKMSWDKGNTPAQIAKDLGLPNKAVTNILFRHYPSRIRLQYNIASALTTDDHNDITSRFLNDESMTEISNDYSISPKSIQKVLKNKLGIDKYNTEMAKRKTEPGNVIHNKITPAMLVKIRELYAAGKTLAYISDHFDNVIGISAIHTAMGRQPDYAELRAKRDERTRKVKHSPVATTNKTPAGIVDNQRLRGPGSRQRSGVDWPKYG